MINISIDLFKPILEKCKTYIINSKSEMQIQEKGKNDVVTNLDIEIESMLINHIKKHFPNDLIISEESYIEGLTDKPTWIIDPIDGTLNLSYGSKIYGIQFCLMIKKEAVFSILYIPELDGLYYAINGQGSYHNGKQLYSLSDFPIERSIVSFGDFSSSSYESRPYQIKLMNKLKDRIHKIRILGSSCMDFCSLASGQTQAYIMFSKRIWEFSAGLLLLKESGIHSTRVSIKNTNVKAICCAHNKDLLEDIKKIINK